MHSHDNIPIWANTTLSMICSTHLFWHYWSQQIYCHAATGLCSNCQQANTAWQEHQMHVLIFSSCVHMYRKHIHTYHSFTYTIYIHTHTPLSFYLSMSTVYPADNHKYLSGSGCHLNAYNVWHWGTGSRWFKAVCVERRKLYLHPGLSKSFQLTTWLNFTNFFK